MESLAAPKPREGESSSSSSTDASGWEKPFPARFLPIQQFGKVIIVPDKRLTLQRPVSPSSIKRIWGEGFRLFLSHKAEVKKQTGQLKEDLEPYGITAFVAHADTQNRRRDFFQRWASLSSLIGIKAEATLYQPPRPPSFSKPLNEK